MANKNGHWYTDKNGNHYFVEDGQSPKEGWEASKRRKMIDGGKYKVSDDGNTYNEVSKDEYDKFEADDADWDMNEDDDFGFDEEEENQRYREAEEEMNKGSEDDDTDAYMKGQMFYDGNHAYKITDVNDEEIEYIDEKGHKKVAPLEEFRSMVESDEYDTHGVTKEEADALGLDLDNWNELDEAQRLKEAKEKTDKEFPEQGNREKEAEIHNLLEKEEVRAKGPGPHRMADIAIGEDEDAVDPKEHNTTPNQSSNPQIARKTKYPDWKEYMTKDMRDQLNDYEYYSKIKDADDFENRIKKNKEYMERNKGKPWMEDSNSKYEKENAMLADPSVRAYVLARNEYDNQLENDFNEYLPIAKQRILEKLLDDNDYYETRYYGKDEREDIDDLYDELTKDFQNKYGYEQKYHGSLFSPLRTHFGDPKSNEEKAEDGGYRRKYDKDRFIGEMLRNGDITFAELKNLLKGKK